MYSFCAFGAQFSVRSFERISLNMLIKGTRAGNVLVDPLKWSPIRGVFQNGGFKYPHKRTI